MNDLGQTTETCVLRHITAIFRDGITDLEAHFSLPLPWESTALMTVKQKKTAVEDNFCIQTSDSATAAERSTKACLHRSKGPKMAASIQGREMQ